MRHISQKIRVEILAESQRARTFGKWLEVVAGISERPKHLPPSACSTNAVLGIRASVRKSGPTPATWVDDSLPFLIRLLSIIQPRVVVSLGVAAYRSCRLAMYEREINHQIPVDASLMNVHRQNPIIREGLPGLVRLLSLWSTGAGKPLPRPSTTGLGELAQLDASEKMMRDCGFGGTSLEEARKNWGKTLGTFQ